MYQTHNYRLDSQVGKQFFLILLFSFLIGIPSSIKGQNLFETQEGKSKQLDGLIKDYQLLKFNPKVSEKLLETQNNVLFLEIPFDDGESWRLVLHRNQLFKGNPIFSTLDLDGKKPFEYEQGVYYHGYIKGQKSNSSIAFSIFKNEVRGLIMYNGKTYVLGKLGPSSERGTNYVIYDDNQLLLPHQLKCETKDDIQIPVGPELDMFKQRQQNTTECVGVYLECDHYVFDHFAPNTNPPPTDAVIEQLVVDYITGMFNEVTLLFQNDGIDIKLTEVAVWEVDDPYYNLQNNDVVNNVDGALATFANYYNNGNVNPPFIGDLGHLISMHPAQGRLGGLAYLDVLCDETKKYAVSRIDGTYAGFPTYSWDVEVVSHELGHNLGSGHTHACIWGGQQIDDCGNYIFVNNGTDDDGDGMVDEADEAEGVSCYDNNNPIIPTSNTGGTVMSYCHLDLGATYGTPGINFNNGFGPLPSAHILSKVNDAETQGCLGDCCPIDATFPTPAEIFVGTTYTFTHTDPDGLVCSYNWTVDGTSLSTTNTLDFTFNTIGINTVCLEIIRCNDADCIDTYCVDLDAVCELNPVTTFDFPTEVLIGTTINFVQEDPNNQICSFDWTFNTLQGPSTPTFEYTPSYEGTHTICLETVYCANTGCTEMFCADIEVLCDVGAGFNYTDPSGVIETGESFTFTDNTTGDIALYSWDFGNGQTSTAVNPPPVLYDMPGAYQVCLQVTSTSIGSCTETTCECVVVNDPIVWADYEICDNGIDDDGDGLVDCYDPDCCSHCEDNYYNACPDDCIDVTGTVPFSFEEQYRLLNTWSKRTIPIVANIDCDPQSEIIGWNPLSSNSFNVIDGISLAIEHTVSFPPGMPNSPNNNATVADLDPTDGKINILFLSNDGYIMCFETTGCSTAPAHLWNSTEPVIYPNSFVGNVGVGIEVADFNGDGVPELYAFNKIFSSVNGDLLVEGGEDNNIGGSSFFDNSISIAADLLPDSACPTCGGLELLVGGQVYAVDLDAICGSPSMIVAREANWPEIHPLAANEIYRNQQASIADFDGNGTLDAIIVELKQVVNSNNDVGGMYVWDIQQNQIICETTFTGYTNRPTVANMDNDPELEIGLIIDGQIRFYDCVNGNLVEVANTIANDDTSHSTGIIAFDFEGDGRQEIVYRDETTLRIISYDANINEYVVLEQEACSSTTQVEHAVIADIDADNETELIIPCDDDLVVYGSNSTPWMPTRGIWNQYNYFATNINDDLTVPTHQQLNHLIPDASFNAYPFQYGIKNAPLPDAEITSFSYACTGNGTEFYIEICNNGDAAMSSNANLSIYSNNPLDPNSNGQLITSLSISDLQMSSNVISVGECINITLPINEPLGQAYAVVNDNNEFILDNDGNITGTLHPNPYSDNDGDQIPDFPIVPLLECDYSNNISAPLFISCCNSIPNACILGPDDCNMVCNPNLCTENTISDNLYAFCNGQIPVWFNSHGRATYMPDESLTNAPSSAGGARLRVQQNPTNGTESKGRGIQTTVGATDNQRYLFSMYKKTETGNNKTRVILANNERGINNGNPNDDFDAQDDCAFGNQNVNDSSGAFEIFETEMVNAVDDVDFRRYVRGFELQGDGDFNDLIIYPSETDANISDIVVTHIELIPDNFTAGEDVIISCLESATIGDYECALSDMTYTWIDLNTNQTIVADAADPILTVSPSITTSYQLVRNFSTQDAAELVSMGGWPTTDIVTVFVESIDLDFIFAPSLPLVYSQVQFNSSSSIQNVSYTWDFGDGGTSLLNNPVHVYQNSGTYNVCLTAMNTNQPNCSKQVCKTITISDDCSPNFQNIYTLNQNTSDGYTEFGTCIEELNGGGYVMVGYGDAPDYATASPTTETNSFIYKLDESGAVVDFYSFNLNTDFEDLQIIKSEKLSDGTIILAGYFRGITGTDPTIRDGIILIKLDANGDYLWSRFLEKQLEGSRRYPLDMIEDHNGDIRLLATFTSDYSPFFKIFTIPADGNPGLIEERVYSNSTSDFNHPKTIMQLPNGDDFILGGVGGFHVARVDEVTGDFVWRKNLDQNLMVETIFLNDDNELVVFANKQASATNYPIVVLRMDLNGNVLWSSEITSTVLFEYFPEGGIQYRHHLLEAIEMESGYLMRIPIGSASNDDLDYQTVRLDEQLNVVQSTAYEIPGYNLSIDMCHTSGDGAAVVAWSSLSANSVEPVTPRVWKMDGFGNPFDVCGQLDVPTITNPNVSSSDNTEVITTQLLTNGEDMPLTTFTLTNSEQSVCYDDCCTPTVLTEFSSNINGQELFIDGIITIPNNTIIEINNSTLRFSPNGKIEVSPTAQLIIDNSILTKNTNCGTNDLWQGIELLSLYAGNLNNSRTGSIMVRNNTTISYATNAILVQEAHGKYDNLIDVSNSFLLNNIQGIHIQKANFRARLGFNIVNNIFEYNDINSPLSTHGIHILSTRLNAENTSLANITDNTFRNLDRGIYTLNLNRNSIHIVENNFDGITANAMTFMYYWGDRINIGEIHPNYTNPIGTIINVDNNIVSNSSVALRAVRALNVQIFNNTFEVLDNAVQLDNVVEYSFTGNKLMNVSGNPVTGNGLRLFNSFLTENLLAANSVLPISDNEFNQFSNGVLFRNYNTTNHMVDLSCNKFFNNNDGIRILNNNSNIVDWGLMINSSDLNELGDMNNPVFNSFSGNANNDIRVSGNNSNLSGYNFPICNGCGEFEPINFTGNIDVVNGVNVMDNTACTLPRQNLNAVNSDMVLMDMELIVVPNPNSGNMELRITHNGYNDEIIQIRMMDMSGRIVGNIHNGILTNDSIPVDANHLPSGIYFIHLTSKTQSVTERIVIAK